MGMDATLTVEVTRCARDRDAVFCAGADDHGVDDKEILTSIGIEPWPPGHGWAFVEYARGHGDFAITSVAVLLQFDAAAKVTRVSLTLGGLCDVPFRLPEAEKHLLGQRSRRLTFPGRRTMRRIDALDDPQLPRWYRRRVAATLGSRAIAIAAERARASGENS